MRGRGLLIAAIVLIVLGLLGAVASAAVLAVTSFTGTGPTPQTSSGGGFSRETTETTATPFSPRGRGRGGTSGTFSSLGEQIWFAGIGADGNPIPRDPSFGPAMMGGCATCHGNDGRGTAFRMMGRTFDAPDIRFSTLASRHVDEGKTVEPWSEADIQRAVRDGIEPGGERLRETMPRWDVSRAEFTELLTYMKRL